MYNCGCVQLWLCTAVTVYSCAPAVKCCELLDFLSVVTSQYFYKLPPDSRQQQPVSLFFLSTAGPEIFKWISNLEALCVSQVARCSHLGFPSSRCLHNFCFIFSHLSQTTGFLFTWILLSFSPSYFYTGILRTFCILRVNVYFSAAFYFGLFFFRVVGSFMWPDLIISIHPPPAALSRCTTSHASSCTLLQHHFTLH